MSQEHIRWTILDYWQCFIHKAFELLPSILVLAIAGMLGQLYGCYADIKRQLWFGRLRTSLKKITGQTDEAILKRWQYATLRNIAKCKAEFSLIDRMDLQMTGLEHLKELGGPNIFIGTHLGNWELQFHALVKQGIPVVALYDPSVSPAQLAIAMKTRVRRAATLPGTRLLEASPIAVREMIRVLERKQNLWVAVDEFKNGLVWAPALGRDLPYGGNRMLVARLAIRASANIIPIRSRRVTGSVHEICIYPALTPSIYGSAHEQACDLADQITNTIEPWVLEDLTQWFWLPQLRLERQFPATGDDR